MKTKISGLIVILSIVLFSCQQQDELSSTSTESDLTLKSAIIAENDATVESVLEETNYEAEFFAESEHLLRELAHLQGNKDIMRGRHNSRYHEGDYPTVSIDTADAGYPIVISIEYGDSTVLHHGRVISGTVSIEISAEKNTDGATRTITLTDCVIDSVAINGPITEVFNGDNSTTRVVTNTTEVEFILADGTVLQRSGTQIREWLEGLETTEHSDDIIQITGSDQITSSEGYTWLKTIINPLIKSGECRHYVQGIVEYSTEGEVIAELDYGDGTCDDVAILTVDGEEIEIELHGKMAKANMHKHQSKNSSAEKGH